MPQPVLRLVIWLLFPLLIMQVVSSTKVQLSKVNVYGDPCPWALEPGPLKVVAIDTDTGLVHLNPEEGGVVAAVVKADVKVKDNENLYIYQSTKQVKVEGSGFENLDVSLTRDVIGQRVMTGLCSC